MSSLQQAYRDLNAAESYRDSIARDIANAVADGGDVHPIKVQMFREAVATVAELDAALKALLKKETT